MQLVLQHCYKTTFYYPQMKPVRQVVVSCVNTDFRLDKTTPYTGVTSLAAKQVCLGPGKRPKRTDFVARGRTTLYHPQQLFAICNNLMCCKRGLNDASKTLNIAFQLVLQQCCKTSCTFTLPVLRADKKRFLFTRKNGDFGAISLTMRSCAAPNSKRRSRIE